MTLMIFLVMFITESATEKLCPLRASIDVLEGEYFFLCFPESMLHFETEGYTINWYKENAGRQKLIKETQRIISQMNFLEFWPAELSDSGNYSVTHSLACLELFKEQMKSLYLVPYQHRTSRGKSGNKGGLQLMVVFLI